MKRVLIVDDHAVVREGLKRMLDERHPGNTVFGDAATPADALRQLRENNWDIAVLDLSLGNASGLELLRQIREHWPRLPVLVLSMHSEQEYAVRAFRAGATGYVTKDVPRAELVRAIDRVLDGGRYVSDVAAEALVAGLGRPEPGPLHQTLSDREFEVFRLIASGKTPGEIADILSLSVKTVSTYRARILEKMRMKTNAELTYYAAHNKLVGEFGSDA